MPDLLHRQTKIQEKRKQTPFRDFLLEVASWYTINLHKNQSLLTRYPNNWRTNHIISEKEYSALWNQINDNNYNLTVWFFEQFHYLRSTNKHPNILVFKQNENSDFSDVVFGAKNAYLSFTLWNNVENIFYSTIVYTHCTNVYNSVKVTNNSQNIYYSKSVTQSFNVYYSRYINNSSDIRFSSNLTWCNNCLMCDNLINQKYCIANQPYDKTTYEYKKNEILLNKSSFDNYFAQVNNKAVNHDADNSYGEWINFSSNIENGYYVTRATNGRNMMFVDGINHANNYYDIFEAGVNSDDFYAVSNAGTWANHLYCSRQVESSSHLFYCYYMENCSYCLGCLGLKNVSYCILNKQYTKGDRHNMVDKIFSQMEKQWLLWSVWPGWINPFYFNDTAAYLIDPSFTKEEVTKLWYLWRDDAIKVDIPTWAQVVKASDLGDYEWWVTVSPSSWANAKDLDNHKDSSVALLSQNDDKKRHIDPTILNKIIVDEQGNYYRIVKMEYDFLIKHSLPLPRKHWLDRMKDNFKIV